MTTPPAPRPSGPLTPYDTGVRCEPHPWQTNRAAVLRAMETGNTDHIGRVDFDDDEGATVVTVHVTRDPDGGHTIHFTPHTSTIRLTLHMKP